jgi:cytochrome c-type biogenesis protein CcmH
VDPGTAVPRIRDGNTAFPEFGNSFPEAGVRAVLEGHGAAPMTVFWIVVALFLVGALLLLLPPLLRAASAPGRASPGGINLAVYRDQWRESERDLANGLISAEALEQVRADIRRRVLEDSAVPAVAAASPVPRSLAFALGVLIPLGSLATYLWLGDPQAAAPVALAEPVGAAGIARHSLTAEQIQQRVTALAERLKRDGNDAEGWLMLGRSYTALGRYRDAATALRRANEVAPGNPGLLADYADVLGMAQNRRLAGEPARLIQQALDIDPRHVKALALAGSVAFEARDFAAARGYWERLVAVLPVGSEMARSIQGSMAEARQLEAAAGGAATPPRAGMAVAGRVTIGAALLAKVGPGDTLFVFARAAQGPRMPLAIVKRPVGGWPFEFSLDDSMAMSPDLRLSGFDRVVIGARISKSGQATPQPGDLAGESVPVTPGTKDLQVVVDREL